MSENNKVIYKIYVVVALLLVTVFIFCSFMVIVIFKGTPDNIGFGLSTCVFFPVGIGSFLLAIAVIVGAFCQYRELTEQNDESNNK